MSENTRSSKFEISIDGCTEINDDSQSSSSFPIPQSQSLPSAKQIHLTTNDDKELDEEEEILVLPISQSQFQEDKQTTDNNNSDTSMQGKLKGDIYEQSTRSIRNAMNFKVASTSSLPSPKSCPICMEPYKAGDEIAWSKNEHCVHAFHLDCMMGWLMSNNDCPMCRQDYLCNESSEV